MPRRSLPAPAQTRLEQIRADVERGLIAADRLTMTARPAERVGDVVYLPLDDNRANEQLRLALTAAAAIVDLAGTLEWPAAERRRFVETQHDQLRQVCGIERPRFLAERRQQPWWDAWQQRLHQPDIVPRAARKTPAVPFKHRLATAIDATGIGVPELATAAKVSERSIWHYLAGTRVPTRRDIVPALERALGVPLRGVNTSLNRAVHNCSQPSKPRKKASKKA